MLNQQRMQLAARRQEFVI